MQKRVIIFTVIFILLSMSALATEMDDYCGMVFECQKADDGYWFDCYYDEGTEDCRCFVGDFSECNVSRASSVQMTPQEINLTVIPEEPELTGFAVAGEYTTKLFSSVKGMGLAAKAFSVVVLIMIVVLIFSGRKDSPEKDLKKARSYHKKAVRAHDKGDDDKAQKYYELSDYYRDKAHDNE
ncbi:hypothetical protein JXB11_03785 [Candidatus Woesearchaeota archaeon]|nr:hypothetical protein [Candidatus Woesearchaeota archaeon]